MKQVIVSTTINAPTEAIRAFDAMPNWELVVIGDRRTPPDYRLDRGTYVPPREQERYDRALSDAIGWDCIQRRNFGLLWARERGAEIVALVDDDNIPYPGWGEGVLIGKEVEVNFIETDLPAFDPVGATNHGHLWHRGYPLELVRERRYDRAGRRRIRPEVQADFWDGDPDVDALCRLLHAPRCTFDPAPFPFASNRMGPFNSQNTFLSGRLLPDYFLFPHIGRMDDIWAAYFVQARGCSVVYQRPSVRQQRNPHDPMRDLQQECLGYERNLELVKRLAEDSGAISGFLPARAAEAFRLYRRHFDHA